MHQSQMPMYQAPGMPQIPHINFNVLLQQYLIRSLQPYNFQNYQFSPQIAQPALIEPMPAI